MRRASVLLAMLLLAACSAGTPTTNPSTPVQSTPVPSTQATITPAPTTPATIPQATPSTPSLAPGAEGTCAVDVVISGGLGLTLPGTMHGNMGWSYDPERWGFSVNAERPTGVPLADGSALPMDIQMDVVDRDGMGPEEPQLSIFLLGPLDWPSPRPGETPHPQRTGVYVQLYWGRSPDYPSASDPPAKGTIAFNGRFSVTLDVTFTSVIVEARSMPATAVLAPGDISAQGTVTCE